MKRIIILIALCLLVLTTTAQNVTNTHFVQEGKMVKIYFDLSKKADVSIYLSTNGGRSYETSPLGHISGNVGEKVRPGKKRCAVWDVTADRENLSCDSICFKVVAREHLRGRKAKIRAAEEAAAAAAEARRLEEERLKAEATTKAELAAARREAERAKAEAEAALAQAKADAEARALSQGEKQVFTVEGVTFTMIHVQGGTFTMGCTSEQGHDCYSNEEPAHSVTLSDYYIGETEVTQALWTAVMGTTIRQQRDIAHFSGYAMRDEGDDSPMYYVSWDECQEFCRKLSQKTGRTFRLPTEAEWEYAARGGNKSRGYKYSGSNTLLDVASNDKIRERSHPVKEKQANELGLYDMSGNVWEWCQDWEGDYRRYSQTNPTGSSSGDCRVMRGGGWHSGDWCCRVSFRSSRNPSYRDRELGFRVVLVR